MYLRIEKQMVKLSDFALNDSILCALGYQLRRSARLTIAQTSDTVCIHAVTDDADRRLDLKGMIYDNDSLVAPGCRVPLDEKPEGVTPTFVTIARDGVLYRFYWYNEKWQISTTGCINPDVTWGAGTKATFNDLIADAKSQWDSEQLDKRYCYYAVLEHPNFINIVKHQQLSLTLIYMINTETLEEISPCQLDIDKGFKNHEQVHLRPRAEHPNAVADPRPLTVDDVGHCFYYADGTVYKESTELYKAAVVAKPNLPDPAQQYIMLIKDPALYRAHLEFFPWNAQLFGWLNHLMYMLQSTIVADFRANVHATVRACHPRHTSYMRDLLAHYKGKTPTDEEIVAHFLSQDRPRIFYMLNPHGHAAPAAAAATVSVVV